MTEKVVTALCLAFILWAVLFGVPMADKGGRLSHLSIVLGFALTTFG